MADQAGITFLRTTREKTSVIYRPDERFPIGGSKVLRESDGDRVAIVAAGITVHEALKACDELRSEGIAVRLIDAYSVKPIDTQTLREAALAARGRLVVVEDHYAEGGLGEAVLAALAAQGTAEGNLKLAHLAVRELPASGKPAELLNAAGISARQIVEAVRGLL
jgi:transketolase